MTRVKGGEMVRGLLGLILVVGLGLAAGACSQKGAPEPPVYDLYPRQSYSR